MTVTYTPELVGRLEACLLEFGWVRGVDFNDVYIDGEGNLCISHPLRWDLNDNHQEVMHRAFTICGVTTLTFEEWRTDVVDE